MDVLKAAIAAKKDDVGRKRKVADHIEKKYMSRRELQEAEERAARLQKAQKKMKLMEEEKKQAQLVAKETGSTLSNATAVNTESKTTEDKEAAGVGEYEAKRRLRVLGQPITLFGETAAERLQRLKVIELSQHERQSASMGRTNMFHEILNQEVQREIQQAQAAALETDKGNTAAESEAKNEKIKGRLQRYKHDKQRSEFENGHKFCLYWLKRMLRMWESDLNERDEEEKGTTIGQHATATQKQTRHNLKPLFKLFKDQTSPKDILQGTEAIIQCCQKRNYSKAQEHYLTLSIGNAAWPIGVTMVGIHERSGREKIFSQKQAHVLNDETQRKYIQGIKRLMTYCEKKFPPASALDSQLKR